MATVVTKTIKPAGGGDYTTLAAWATARLGVALVDTVERAEVYGGGSAGDVDFPTGSTTDATSRIEIVSSPDGVHAGAYSSTKSRIGAVGCNASSLQNVSISSLIIDRGANSYSPLITTGSTSAPSSWYVDKCVLLCRPFSGRTSDITGISGAITTRNCILYNASNQGYGVAISLPSKSVLCCTIKGSYTGVKSTGYLNVSVKNCIVDTSASSFDGSSGFDTLKCASNVATVGPILPGATIGTVQFVDATNHDYHLSAADTVARGAGVNLTSSGITTDIDGQTRPATGAWDIGADQYIAPAPTGPWGTPKFGISQPFGAQKFGVTPWM